MQSGNVPPINKSLTEGPPRPNGGLQVAVVAAITGRQREFADCRPTRSNRAPAKHAGGQFGSSGNSPTLLGRACLIC